MTERHLDIVDRLRGQYHLPVNDGAGPLNGSMTFSREFPTPPIQKEAADEIERLRDALKPFADAVGDLHGQRDTDHIWESPAAMNITVGNLRHARSVIEQVMQDKSK